MRSSAVVVSFVLVGCFDPSAGPGVSTDDPSSTAMQTGGNTVGQTQSETNGNETDPPASESSTAMQETDPPAESTATEEGPVVECDGAEGERDPSCPDDAPFCIAGVCTGCDGAPAFQCAAVDPDAPACDASGACVACNEHDQCESGACRIDDGRCFAGANTLHVDNHAECASADGSADAPLCSVGEALDVVAGQAEGSAWIVRVAGSTDPYEGSVAISSAHPLAIVGPDAGLAATLRSTGTWTVRVSGEVYLARVQIEGGSDVVSVNSGEVWIDDAALQFGDRGVAVDGGRANVRRASIRGHNTLAIDVQPNAAVFVRETVIADNIGAMRVAGEAELHAVTVTDNYVGGGIWVGGTLRVRNSFLHDNLYVRGAIEAVDGANVDVLYTTIVDAFECTAAANVSIRNSIAIGGLACSGATITTSAVEPGFEAQGEGNVALALDDLADVFVFPDPYEPDYHLLPDATVLGVARWRAGDPAFDVDGDPRPSIDDSADAPGADAITP